MESHDIRAKKTSNIFQHYVTYSAQRKGLRKRILSKGRVLMAVRTGLKVFYDSFSQPCRAVLLLLHANNLQHEPRLIQIAKGSTPENVCVCVWTHNNMAYAGEHMTDEEFIRINPHKKVPAIDDNGFTLSERLIGLFYSMHRNSSTNVLNSHAVLLYCGT